MEREMASTILKKLKSARLVLANREKYRLEELKNGHNVDNIDRLILKSKKRIDELENSFLAKGEQ
jgi:hypothetical protein